MQTFVSSLRVAAASLLVCVAGYTVAILAVAQLTPGTAQGSLLVREDGSLLGSRLIAQKFERPGYFWSRPSAPDYDASGAAGSNKSPTNPDLTKRAAETVAKYGATKENPLPAELAAASGGGLDPHVTVRGALYQVPRIAEARGMDRARIAEIVESHSFAPGGALTPDRLVNVLELNLALDAADPDGAAPYPPPAPEPSREATPATAGTSG